jgi:GR25 family glycosyltransferase involved in LPS biosynthesis
LSAPKAFILHLKRAVARRANVEALQRALPIQSEVVDAVEGASLSRQEIYQVTARRRFRPSYPFALTAAEIGAFLTHRAAWKRIAEENLDFAFVFEDDARIDSAAFVAIAAFAAAERAKWDYVILPASGRSFSGDVVARRGELALLRPHAPPLRAIGQIVSQPATERLLAHTLPFDRPVDTFLQMTWVTDQPILIASPSPVSDVSRESGGTTIQRKSMRLVERLHHEIVRPIYRAQVLRRYRRSMSLVSR